LVPCAGCGRHAKASETACPFCGEARTAVAAPRGWPAKRLARAAAFSFGAVSLTAVLATASGCSGSHRANDDAGDEADAGSIDEEDAGRDAGNVFPPYGTPPDSGIAPLYGGAPGD
jgi:hypothetical protein